LRPTSRLGAALGTLVAIVLTLGAVIVTASSPPAPPGPGDGAGAASSFDNAFSQPVAPRSGSFQDAQLSGYSGTAPTADKAQSKLWFAGGSWWALMIDPKSQNLRIHRLDWATQEWQDTGTVVDDRSYAEADCLWDGTHLYVASAAGAPYRSHAGLVSRFSYDEATKAWTRDRGFPVQLTTHGVSTMMIERDSTGQLWTTYIDGGRLVVNRTLGDDLTWGRPFVLPLKDVDTTAARSTIVAAGKRIVVIWSNKAENEVYFAAHADADADDAWQAQRSAVEGADEADDHLNAKAAIVDGEARIYVAMKTSLDAAPGHNPNDAQMLLLEARPDGSIHKYLAGRIRDLHTRPLVLIDETDGMLYFVATSPFGGGRVYYKRTPLDAISFSPGRGQMLVASDADPLINDVTSTKQPISADTGLVVLAFDRSTGRYLHGVLDLGGPRWTAKSRPADSPGPAPTPAPSAPPASPEASPATPAPPVFPVTPSASPSAAPSPS
jgi:hypothetical protein